MHDIITNLVFLFTFTLIWTVDKMENQIERVKALNCTVLYCRIFVIMCIWVCSCMWMYVAAIVSSFRWRTPHPNTRSQTEWLILYSLGNLVFTFELLYACLTACLPVSLFACMHACPSSCVCYIVFWMRVGLCVCVCGLQQRVALLVL